MLGRPMVTFVGCAVAVFAFAGIAGAMQEYEDLKVLVAEIEADIIKANSAVIEDDYRYFFVGYSLNEDGTLLFCWLDLLDWIILWEYVRPWNGDNTNGALGDRIFHDHMKDVWWGHGDGTVGVFGG